MTGLEILREVRLFTDNPGYSRYVEINRAYRKIAKMVDFNFLRKSDESIISFIADQSTYTINMKEVRAITGIYVKGGNDARWKYLEEVEPKLFQIKTRENQDLNASDNTTKPEFYSLSDGPNHTLSIVPTPDQAYSVRLEFIQSTQEVTQHSNVNLPEDYLDTVAMLAAGYILERDSDDDRRRYGIVLINRATGEFSQLVRDSHHNRTNDVDRTPIAWKK